MAVFVREVIFIIISNYCRSFMAEIWAGSVSCTGSICLIRHCGAPMETGIFTRIKNVISGCLYPVLSFKINELSFNVNMLGDLWDPPSGQIFHRLAKDFSARRSMWRRISAFPH